MAVDEQARIGLRAVRALAHVQEHAADARRSPAASATAGSVSTRHAFSAVVIPERLARTRQPDDAVPVEQEHDRQQRQRADEADELPGVDPVRRGGATGCASSARRPGVRVVGRAGSARAWPVSGGATGPGRRCRAAARATLTRPAGRRAASAPPSPCFAAASRSSSVRRRRAPA